VVYDALGVMVDRAPRFVRREFVKTQDSVAGAPVVFVAAVEDGSFRASEHRD
jgi:ketopantoate hydroxymethyltransferase